VSPQDNTGQSLRILRGAWIWTGKIFGFVLAIDGALSLRRSWREDVKDVGTFLGFFLHYLPPTLGLFMKNFAYCLSITFCGRLLILFFRYGKHVKAKLKEKGDAVLPLTVGFTVAAVIAEVLLWEPGLLEPSGQYYADFRQDGIIAIWVGGVTMAAIWLYILFAALRSQTRR